MVHDMGYQTGIDLDSLVEAARSRKACSTGLCRAW